MSTWTKLRNAVEKSAGGAAIFGVPLIGAAAQGRFGGYLQDVGGVVLAGTALLAGGAFGALGLKAGATMASLVAANNARETAKQHAFENQSRPTARSVHTLPPQFAAFRRPLRRSSLPVRRRVFL